MKYIIKVQSIILMQKLENTVSERL